ncbi:putative oxidoreductase YjmC [Symmachiella macrocystis]|uniref:Putative oxidoreductase YjmC n=1 Tax=Symmachiella macrocystis TaxID=2527985 RepID=A0A5C6BK22_9PLAN|nr:Ldh family oxidoreductase [Symmachiella macrocystis]TWU12345.1 putative oxidoreductase YjmC [Symmachiella macrocystis]
MAEKPQTCTFSHEYLEDFTAKVFVQFGIPQADAQQAALVLSASDLRGIESHGVARLLAYVELLKEGLINPRPNLKILRETPSTAAIDADNGLGLVIGPRANEIAMEKAEAVGSGWVTVSHTNHFGIAGYYPLQALERDLIGWAMTNSSRMVAPLWGAERMLGTNPIAIAFPGDEEPPIVIDLATSAVAFGKIEMADRKQQELPLGWAIDETGVETTSPAAMMEGGALLPVGSNRDRGGHKGYCLSAMVDILTGVLGGANWGPFAPQFVMRHRVAERERTVGKGLGHFFGAMQIAGFMDPAEFKTRIDDWIRTFRATKPAPGSDGVLIPGDPERAAEAERREQGIPLVLPVVEDLRKVARISGVPFEAE